MSLTHELSPAIADQIEQQRDWIADPAQFDTNREIEDADGDDVEDRRALMPLGFGDEGIQALIDTDTGEVIDLPDCPLKSNGEAVTKDAIAWYGARRNRAVARKLSAQAGHAAYMEAAKVVADREFGAQIKSDESLIRWLDNLYLPGLELFAKAALAGAKAKSVIVEGVKLAFRQVGGGIDVENPEAAIEWAEEWCPVGVRVKKEIAKTELAKVLGKEYVFPEGCGLVRVAKSDKFEVS